MTGAYPKVTIRCGECPRLEQREDIALNPHKKSYCDGSGTLSASLLAGASIWTIVGFSLIMGHVRRQ